MILLKQTMEKTKIYFRRIFYGQNKIHSREENRNHRSV